MRTGVPCNENRFFPVKIDSQGVPCELYWVWVCSVVTSWSLGWPPSGFSCWLLSGLLSWSLGGPLSWSYVRFPRGIRCRCPSGPTCRYHNRPSSSDWPMRRPMSGLGHWIHV